MPAKLSKSPYTHKSTFHAERLGIRVTSASISDLSLLSIYNFAGAKSFFEKKLMKIPMIFRNFAPLLFFIQNGI